jgi:branched-chain amino acid transport system substrate-binding protein
LAVAALLFSGVMVAGCGSSSSSSSGGSTGSSESGESGTIKIGALLPLTGPAAFFGPLQRDGLNLALAKANGEAGGRKVELIVVDSGADLGSAQTAARRLIEEEGVSIIIGPLQSDLMAGLVPYYEQTGIPAISLLNQPKQLSGKVITPQGDLQSGSAPVGLYAGEELGVKTASMEVSDYIAGEDVVEGFKSGFEKAGGSVVQEQLVPLSASDFGPYLSNLKEADAMVAWNVGTTQNFLEEYLKRGQFEHTMLGYGDAITEEQLQELGPQTKGWIAPLTYTWRLENPVNKEFVAEVRKKYHRNPVAQIDEGSYEALTVALEAINVTKGNTDPEKIKEAILGLELETPAGPVRFNSEGNGVRNVYIIEAAEFNGEMGWKPIKTYENVGE